ncbi:type VI secretion system baseplate subunit TssF/IglH [Cysteiniphilum sp. 6C5]|uniref:type VI secretion system baseplate subunit TssF/IglH n=1 Tax=unclassified Cysteiniphilum TaxID=2610889 RepID=UPI003F85E491
MQDVLAQKFIQLQSILESDVKDLKRDVLQYIYNARLRSFNTRIPYLQSAIPYKLFTEIKLKPSQVSAVDLLLSDRIEALTKDGQKCTLHPMFNTQILPCEITNRRSDNDKLYLSLNNLAGFFYLEQNYIDIWCFDENEILASNYFDGLKEADFLLEFTLQGEKKTKRAVVEKLHYAYMHPHEYLKDQLRDRRFYQGLRLQFNNDFYEEEIKSIELVIDCKGKMLDVEEGISLIKINHLPLINYHIDYALPIQIDGSKDSYPIILNHEKNDLLLRELEVSLIQEAKTTRLYPQSSCGYGEPSYTLVPAEKSMYQRYTHIQFHNIPFEPGMQAQIKAAWHSGYRQLGRLESFSIPSKPIESLKLAPVMSLEASAPVVLDFYAMQLIQKLSYKRNILHKDLLDLVTEILPLQYQQEKLTHLIAYLRDVEDQIVDVENIKAMNFCKDSMLNYYLNAMFKVLVQFKNKL